MKLFKTLLITLSPVFAFAASSDPVAEDSTAAAGSMLRNLGEIGGGGLNADRNLGVFADHKPKEKLQKFCLTFVARHMLETVLEHAGIDINDVAGAELTQDQVLFIVGVLGTDAWDFFIKHCSCGGSCQLKVDLKCLIDGMIHLLDVDAKDLQEFGIHPCCSLNTLKKALWVHTVLHE